MDSAAQWTEWLFQHLEADLEAAELAGLDIDAFAIGSAHVIHGAQLAVHGGQLSRGRAAEYLRSVAAAIEEEWPYLPVLRSLPKRQEGC